MIKLVLISIFSIGLTLGVKSQNNEKPSLSNTSSIKKTNEKTNEKPTLENSSKKDKLKIKKKTKQEGSTAKKPFIGVMDKKDEL